MLFKKLFVTLGLVVATASQAETALINTSLGDITVELNSKAAPVTVANFIRYAKSGHYNGTIFHRVINNFMIQGGGFDANMNEKPTATPITNEAFNGLKNDKYTVAMARTNEPHSATSQFFINVKGNDFLNYTSKTTQGWGYAVFGRVTNGFDVVDKIKGSYTKTVGSYENVPIKPIVINSVRITP